MSEGVPAYKGEAGFVNDHREAAKGLSEDMQEGELAEDCSRSLDRAETLCTANVGRGEREKSAARTRY
jgi:hypothetical protein